MLRSDKPGASDRCCLSVHNPDAVARFHAVGRARVVADALLARGGDAAAAVDGQQVTAEMQGTILDVAVADDLDLVALGRVRSGERE